MSIQSRKVSDSYFKHRQPDQHLTEAHAFESHGANSRVVVLHKCQHCRADIKEESVPSNAARG
jgi:hypothetical protein